MGLVQSLGARLVALAVVCCGCATAADDIGTTPYDAAAIDSGAPGDTSTDSTTDTNTGDTATSDSAADSGMATDSATTDSGVDTEPVDTGTVDTGTVDTAVTDTATTCSASGKYGPKCKTNADCSAIPVCGYVCCAFDPFLMTNLGCGRTSSGTVCLP